MAPNKTSLALLFVDKKTVIEFSTLNQISLRIAMSEVKFLQNNQKLTLVPSPGKEEIVPLTFA